MKIDKIYIYSGAALLASVGLYFLITKKKKITPEQAIKAEEDRNSRPGIPTAQTNIPDNLAPILKLPVAQAKKLLIGKNVYTKVDDVNVRTTAIVNNGYTNNIMAKIPTAGTFVGKIADVVDADTPVFGTEQKTADGRKFKFIKVKPFSQAALDAMNANDNRYFASLQSDFSASDFGYLGEEVIKI